MEQQLIVRFWGVRGSIPSPGFSTLRYGGNTPCVEVEAGRTRLIFDGGTGLRILGQALLKQMPVEAHLFFSHTHWDHIQGFPFFTPAFVEGNRFHIYGTVGPQGQTIKQRLTDQMLHPNFPVPLQVMRGDLKFYDLEVGQALRLGAVTVCNRALNHPGGAVGYRVSWQGRVVSYVTDTEHHPEDLDPNVLALAQGADILIYDATYTDAEYQDAAQGKVGWGHSTWQAAVQVAVAAAVKQLVLFHHDPLHDDGFLDRVAAAAQARFSQSVVAYEGLTLALAPHLPLHDSQVDTMD